jgi:hypothetical protein
MISSSSSLQRLRLEDLRMPDEDEQWVIHAPNLQSLLISSMFDYGLQINYLPALEEAEINLRNYVDVQEIMNVISRLDQARILQLSMPVNCFNSIPLDPCFSAICIRWLVAHNFSLSLKAGQGTTIIFRYPIKLYVYGLFNC